jgi:hypothetical protein
MYKFNLIAFYGHRGSGKDYYCNGLVNKHKFIKLKFANYIQDIIAVLADMYEVDLSHRELFEDRKWKDELPLFSNGNQVDSKLFNYTPRDLLINIGQGLKEAIDPYLWCSLLYRTICKEISKGNTNICISDLRFLDEAKLIKNIFNGFIVGLTNTNLNINEDVLDETEKNYDLLIPYTDTYILNNFNQQDLTNKSISIQKEEKLNKQLTDIINQSLSKSRDNEIEEFLKLDFKQVLTRYKIEI